MDLILYFATDIARRSFISEEAGVLGFTRIDLLDDSAVGVFVETHDDGDWVRWFYRHLRGNDSILDWDTP
jgi:hypothetical protein